VADQQRKLIAQLEREIARTKRRLQEAEAVIDLQRKIAKKLGIPLTPPPEVSEEEE
jgi:hypothetical protein